MIQHVVVLIILAIGIWWICVQFVKFNISTYTDNAQVRRYIVPVTARVQGYIKDVCFDEYSYVHKGDTLVIIEDREYQLKLAEAEAELQNAISGKTVMSSAINTTENNLGVNDASISGTKAELENAERDMKRYAALIKTKAVTQKQYDDAKTHYERTKAEYDMLCRQKQSTLLTKAEQTERLSQQDANIKLAKVHKDYAALNVSYTIITAPTDGYTSKKTLQEGQFVQPGQTLLSIVDDNDVWIIANYKETQTANMKIGDRVRLTVDAIPDVEYIGAIESISNATGAQYSIVPQDNATGNFVKVEQRIPVKIRLTKDNTEDNIRRLRAGLNVECEMID